MKHQKNTIINFTIPLFMIVLMLIPLPNLLLMSWDQSWEFDFRKIDPKLVDTLKLIDHHGIIETSSFSQSSSLLLKSRNQQLIRQRWLLKNATTNDLINLIDFPKDHIRAIAFKGLCKRNHPEVFNVLKKFLTEKERTIWVRNLSIPNRLVEYCFEHIMGYQLPYFPPRPPQKDNLKILTKSQRTFIFNALKWQKRNEKAPYD